MRDKGLEGDISRISDYRGGESLKLIHWKLSARHDQLKVKELSAGIREPVVLDLNLIPGRQLEERLGKATHLINRIMREGRPVGLKAGQQNMRPALGRRHRLQLLRILAEYAN